MYKLLTLAHRTNWWQKNGTAIYDSTPCVAAEPYLLRSILVHNPIITVKFGIDCVNANIGRSRYVCYAGQNVVPNSTYWGVGGGCNQQCTYSREYIRQTFY